jgi:hypothetical protein
VSIETGAPASALEHRLDAAQLLVGRTPSEPGRVDSPPTSTIAASRRRAAAGRSRRRPSRGWRLIPPSENESGVTLTTPITYEGRGPQTP